MSGLLRLLSKGFLIPCRKFPIWIILTNLHNMTQYWLISLLEKCLFKNQTSTAVLFVSFGLFSPKRGHKIIICQAASTTDPICHSSNDFQPLPFDSGCSVTAPEFNNTEGKTPQTQACHYVLDSPHLWASPMHQSGEHSALSATITMTFRHTELVSNVKPEVLFH